MKKHRAIALALACLVFAGCSGGAASFQPPISQDALAPMHSSAGLQVFPASVSVPVGSTNLVLVSESGYTGKIKSDGSCKKFVNVSPASGKGPKLTVILSGTSGGACKMTFSDEKGRKAQLTITV